LLAVNVAYAGLCSQHEGVDVVVMSKDSVFSKMATSRDRFVNVEEFIVWLLLLKPLKLQVTQQKQLVKHFGNSIVYTRRAGTCCNVGVPVLIEPLGQQWQLLLLFQPLLHHPLLLQQLRIVFS